MLSYKIRRERIMYKYTVQAFNESDLGKLAVINIVVTAATEEEALEKAKTIKERTTYSVIGIEVLEGDSRPQIKKG
jgi:hypothetical protein